MKQILSWTLLGVLTGLTILNAYLTQPGEPSYLAMALVLAFVTGIWLFHTLYSELDN